MIVSSDDSKRNDCPLVKVTEIYPCKGRHIRLGKIKMKAGDFLRLTSRLVPLEVSQYSDVLRNQFTNI